MNFQRRTPMLHVLERERKISVYLCANGVLNSDSRRKLQAPAIGSLANCIENLGSGLQFPSAFVKELPCIAIVALVQVKQSQVEISIAPIGKLADGFLELLLRL